jgi:hypothetical protein
MVGGAPNTFGDAICTDLPTGAEGDVEFGFALRLTEFDLERYLRKAYRKAWHQGCEQHPSVGRIGQHA